MKKPSIALLVSVALNGLAGCGPAAAVLRFTNATPEGQALLTEEANATPTVFGMKLLQVYLSEGSGDGAEALGFTQSIWLNPQCVDAAGEEQNCDIVPENQYGPVPNVVTDYFDFSPGVDVNAALQAQARPIEPGTYAFVRMDFCTVDDGVTPSARWGGTFDGSEVQQEIPSEGCVRESDQIEPPLEIGSGDQVIVTLSYDLTDTVRGSPGETAQFNPGSRCVDADGNTWCFDLPVFRPAATFVPSLDDEEPPVEAP